MTAKEIDTKEKILVVANELFALKGYNGTSVRDIASKAEVNVAAINYHFKNKMNLFCEVFRENQEWMAKGIKKIGADASLSLSEFGWEVFRYFTEHSMALKNNFRIFLNDDIEFPEGFFEELFGRTPEEIGPPGSEIFLEKITQEVGEEVDFELRHWAMRSIFAHIVHFAVCRSSGLLGVRADQIPHFSLEAYQSSVQHLIAAIVTHLQSNE
jgi:AcrR family transcriptional regulator